MIALLHAEQESRGLLDDTGGAMLGEMLQLLATERSDGEVEDGRSMPERLGRYRVVRELRRGGWGDGVSRGRRRGWIPSELLLNAC
ncbi:MAG: hypothetical protein H0U67_06100 [Gemmatimonadetes bacterium]|nr:hypothetical protein [Gemmatimonadota bacterium]